MASPAVAPCFERERLFREFKAANQDLILIHSEEIQAAMRHDVLSDALTLFQQLLGARKRRDLAAEDLKRHIREHGCR